MPRGGRGSAPGQSPPGDKDSGVRGCPSVPRPGLAHPRTAGRSNVLVLDAAARWDGSEADGVGGADRAVCCRSAMGWLPRDRACNPPAPSCASVPLTPAPRLLALDTVPRYVSLAEGRLICILSRVKRPRSRIDGFTAAGPPSFWHRGALIVLGSHWAGFALGVMAPTLDPPAHICLLRF